MSHNTPLHPARQYQYCAPTRGSFLTGRLPYKLAATRANLIPWTLLDGIHLDYAMLPAKLKAAGYTSHHIGKWHQGLYTPAYTPVGRGFDASYGFLEGGEDHNKSTTFGNFCHQGEVDLSKGLPPSGAWPSCTAWAAFPNVALHSYYDPNSTDVANFNPYPAHVYATEAECQALCSSHVACAGYSWRSVDPTHHFYHHCFLISKDGGAHAVSEAFQSKVCTARRTAPPPGAGLTTVPAIGDNGTYTGALFSREAERVVGAFGARVERWGAAPAPPRLFLYYALHDTHAPLEAPWAYVAPYAAAFPQDTKVRA